MDLGAPIFSIIIPTHNRCDLLKRAVNSVINQSYSNWELIVVDDGSTDGTKELLESVKDDRILYIYQEHSERSTARNRGIEEAQGNYICFLDDDDEYKPQYLSSFYAYLEKNDFPKIILRTGFIQLEGSKKKEVENFNIRNHKNPVRFAAFNMCGVWSLCIPREFLEKDSFPAQFPHWQDTHLILRLLARYPFHQLNEFGYCYHIHSEMGSKNVYKSNLIVEKANINVKAIQHFFKNYNDLVSEFLPSHTERFLVAEKYLQYAINDQKHNRGKNVVFFLKKTKYYLHPSLLKYYFVLIKQKILG
jgi:glycosyltransferase involved in cell wall biosynthesis